jgi:hypothetical protein
MKIAYVYSCNQKIGYTLSHSLARFWRAEGHKVDEFNLISTNQWFDTSILDKLHSSNAKYDLVFVLDLGHLFDYRIHKDNFKCPVVLLAGDDPQNFKIKHPLIKRVFMSIKNLVYSSEKSSFHFYGNSICAKQFDHVFTHQKYCVSWYQKLGFSASWLPYWYDTKIFLPEKTKKEFDLVTVMFPRLRCKKMIHFLEKYKKFTFKNGVGSFGRDCSKFYQRGKIVFNMSNHGEYTMRIPEVLGTGSFLLTDRIPAKNGLSDHFEDGKHLVTYKNRNDLLNKIDFYLAHDEERLRIARQGFEQARKHHSESARVQEINRVLSQLNISRSRKKVSFHILSWNRPLLLQMTLESLKISLSKSRISYEVILLDQDSHESTKEIIRRYSDFIDKPIWMEKNIGMAEAWKKMHSISNAEYCISVENDWWCDAHDDKWLRDAIRVMDEHHELSFLKLRKINDRQYGYGSIEHDPWTVKPFPSHVVKTGYLGSKKTFYSAPAQNCSFTFNPILMRDEFMQEISHTYKDKKKHISPLRSGEDNPILYWKQQRNRFAGTLIHGPFRHIGFMSSKDHLLRTPLYLTRHIMRKLFHF